MARLHLCRPLPYLTLSPTRYRTALHPSVTAVGFFTTSTKPFMPSNVGNHGLAAEDARIGDQAPEPLTLRGIEARRAKAGKLVAGTASYSDSDMFKSPQNYNKPKARRWDHLLSPESVSRKPCVLKLAAKHLKKPGLISLGGGLPSAEIFPINEISMKVPAPPHFAGVSLPRDHTIPEGESGSGSSDATIGKHDVRDHDGVYDLSIALNYGQSIGSAQMVRWVTEHTELVCRPPYADWRCALTIGSTGALESSLRMFCDRTRGDSILTEEYSFSTALETAAPLGIGVFGVEMDGEGLLPDRMDEIISTWDEGARGKSRPRVLYTVPSGQNPTGATQGEARRREIYKVCRKHDVFIFEDEPYYFLQMPDYTADIAARAQVNGTSPTTPTAEQFLQSLIPSLLSMDTDGRVLRMDSFSKVLVPGARMGWIAASEQVVERYIRHAECASQGPSGFSQVMLHKLVDETWGHEGYLLWLMRLRDAYAQRRDTILDACERHLPKEVVSWVPPKAGMFLWLHVDHTKHPEASTKTILEMEADIFDSCIEKGVLACRGSWFRAEHDVAPRSLFFRVTFAAASEEDMDHAIKRFGSAVRESFGI
ncbi:pyridoxal phosphate-dependent transferase [Xylariaceae sp. FL0016]|nr:pyridoxal phosphate-dependent transferase [Xylariaceae sp. FL0016]